MIKDINGINMDTPEGKLLLAAIAKISTESQTDKTPGAILGQLNTLAKQMYKHENADLYKNLKKAIAPAKHVAHPHPDKSPGSKKD